MNAAPTFDPFADGLSFPVVSDLEAGWRARWLAAHGASVPGALTSLRRSFGGAVDLHGVPEWLAAPRPANALAAAGWVFAALDYFSWPATPRADTPALHAYLQQRHLDCWHANGDALLEWLAVHHQVPEEWLPHSIVERQLSTLLRRLPAVVDVDVTAEMRLTPPGGSRWLREQSHEHWSTVGASTSAGTCCPVVAFGDTGPIALLAFESGDGVRCYDPSDPGRVTTIAPPSVDGLLRLRYEPSRPPLSTYQRVTGAVGLGRIAWKLARTWRMFRRARL